MRIYENPNKTAENRLKTKSYYMPKGISEKYLLNGKWNFAFFGRDIDVPEKIEVWDTIDVPSCWQLKGYEAPNYSNLCYPYPVDPPFVPDDNPCGVYERTFDLNKKWGRLYYVFEGVSSCAFLYINGNYVGFTQGNHLQAQFEITDFVNEGRNTVTVKVLKWCCGSYLEDQDFFRFNGIFRDTYILQRPFGHIEDVEIIPNLKNISVKLNGSANIKIYDGELLLCSDDFSEEFVYAPENPVFWNAENPHLYTVILEREKEILEFKTGLRKIEVSDKNQLLINGQSVKLKGVNHHDTSMTGGWYQTDEEIKNDLLLMKKLNINCIRTSHYPPVPYLAQLADELGFYVILETDIETHGFAQRSPGGHDYDVGNDIWPGCNELWLKEMLERMERAVELFKNFTCVFMWSTGNESGHGINHKKMIKWTQQRDPSRLIHCEDATRKGEYDVGDVCSGMYWSLDDLEQKAQNKDIKKPIILCEYSHSMGNSPGDVWDYNKLFNKYDNIIGGCIWEWADHTVVVDGVCKYGGDFEGELTHDANFCCDGLVMADRSLKAGSLEAKAAYQPMATEYKNGVLKVTNLYDFTDFSQCELICETEFDGKVISSENLPISLEPHKSAEISVKVPNDVPNLGTHLNVYLKKDGYTVAETQHKLAEPTNIKFEKANDTVSEDNNNFYIKTGNLECVISKHYGTFVSIKANGVEQLSSKTEITSERAVTDNDKYKVAKWLRKNNWEGENLDVQFTKIYSCCVDDGVVKINGSLAGISRMPYFRYTVSVSADKDGKIKVMLNGNVRENTTYLPRLGFEFSLLEENRDFNYYGFGPYEAYSDMHHGSKQGFYESNVEKEYVPYIRPQEHGNHFGTKKLGIGRLVFESDAEFEFNASRYSTAALQKATHTNELEEDGSVHLRVDYKVTGIGSGSCGPEVAEKYRLSEKEIDFCFYISAV